MENFSDLPDFTRDDVVQWLGAGTVAKGEGYLDRISRCETHAALLRARVRGHAARQYTTQVSITGGRLFSDCSCPLGGDCKHVAALLLHVLRIRQKGKASDVSPGVLSWITDLRHFSQAVEKKRSKKSTHKTPRIFYRLEWKERNGRSGAQIALMKGSDTHDFREWSLTDRALVQPPQFVGEEDISILRQLLNLRRAAFLIPYHRIDASIYPLDHYDHPAQAEKIDFARLIRQMLATGRLLAGLPPIPLVEGAPRQGKILWQEKDKRQHPVLHTTPPATAMIAAHPPWYLDLQEGWLGPVQLDLVPELLGKIFSLPPLSPGEATLVAETLKEVAPQAPRPNVAAASDTRVIDAPLRGVLRLASLDVLDILPWRDYRRDMHNMHTPGHDHHHDRKRVFDYAEPVFCYGEMALAVDDARAYVSLPDGGLARIERRFAEEAALLAALARAGLQPIPAHRLSCYGQRPQKMYGLANERAWESFMTEQLPVLRGAGWQIQYEADFRHHFHEVESWDADLREEDSGWLGLDMGVTVAGERLPLAPMLAELLRQEPRWLDAISLTEIPDDENVGLITGDGRHLRVKAERIKPIARLLIDLFDGYHEGETRLRLSRFDAARLDALLQDRSRWQFRGEASIIALAERLKESHGIQEVAPPEGMRLELRDYQRHGLAWLQYLREHGLSGILADDMGLGKTAQTLAHLLMEKEAGRLDRPALVVLPTSLIFNWKNEAARFAPGLRVLNLHGQGRKASFAQIPENDVALTTYPLLWRDSEQLAGYEYHMLILDEAQMVKNARSKGAAVVRQLRARHRLCLTGTPLENHLGELWAQFDFLLPGFLGDQKSFTRLWRNPIEKYGDLLRRDLLARRIRPFILRRKKDEVARELPDKTIIIRTVELSGGQRDLYETVRAAMDEKVRSEIAHRGFTRSQIVILDALLKLRQVCCDPRLVKSAAARKVKEKAKLNLLMDMLPEMVEEGRRILLFSQFTAMLELIRQEFDAIGLRYEQLTGETKDRETPIQAFQRGEVPVFLISLKAGGVGLNLTTADTVIHYDPWWNPAAENQATDRAHRLGQEKPVFVYKLIAAGSIEEKILALQEQKAELVAGILSEGASEVKFGEADLAALFEPLP
ncbi:MAG: DEAD/DEAH box helicase [Zoogloeaceae bacterium]|jgi:superfamily II DNA or RNA helicase|nr:DEAD/DEAH box helicase [Zoogloeaceae bacterium]